MATERREQKREPREAAGTRREKGPRPIGRSGPPINMDELRDLIALLNENQIAEFELERPGFRIRLRRGFEFESPSIPAAAVPVTAVPSAQTFMQPATPVAPVHPGASAITAASGDQDLHIIESPIVGTFYRSRSPNAEPFVKTGSNVMPETVVCIIEAMKLMNEIQAETSGEVVKIYVENGQPVEYGQPLFGVKG